MNRVLALFIILSIFLPLEAVVAKKQRIPALAQQSEAIAIGRITDVKTVLIGGEPWTRAAITTETFLKGPSRTTFHVRIPGGVRKIQGKLLVTAVEGMPLLNVNQRAVFFIKGSQQESFDLTGLEQGFWRVENREGKEVVTQSSDETDPGIPLKKFLEEIRSALRDQKKLQ